MSMSLALQGAIHEALTGHAPLMAIISGVYDSVPQSTAAPYVTIGEDNMTDWSTDRESGGDFSITIHTWSEHRGRKETKQIQGAVYDALHRAELSVTGYHFVSIDFESGQSFVDSDQLTRHGVQNFRVLIDQL